MDCENTKWPNCPRCGKKYAGEAEDLSWNDCEQSKLECSSCCESFVAVASLEIEWSTAVNEEAADNGQFGEDGHEYLEATS